MKVRDIGFLFSDMLDCPDCDIKPGQKDSKICKDHLITFCNITGGMSR